MAPDDLEAIARPVVSGDADYAKANRLVSGEAWQLIPPLPRQRLAEPADKIASGYWHVADSQSGFGRIARHAREARPRPRLPRYGFPNDMLVHLNVVEARVRDVPRAGLQRRRAVGIRYSRDSPPSRLLLKRSSGGSAKYVIRDFHPLVFFYVFRIAMFIAGLGRHRKRSCSRSSATIPPATMRARRAAAPLRLPVRCSRCGSTSGATGQALSPVTTGFCSPCNRLLVPRYSTKTSPSLSPDLLRPRRVRSRPERSRFTEEASRGHRGQDEGGGRPVWLL